MFIYALLKGVRIGLLDDMDGSFVTTAKKAYEYATSNRVLPQPDGTMDWNNTVVVGSLEPGNDYEVRLIVVLDDSLLTSCHHSTISVSPLI